MGIKVHLHWENAKANYVWSLSDLGGMSLSPNTNEHSGSEKWVTAERSYRKAETLVTVRNSGEWGGGANLPG